MGAKLSVRGAGVDAVLGGDIYAVSRAVQDPGGHLVFGASGGIGVKSPFADFSAGDFAIEKLWMPSADGGHAWNFKPPEPSVSYNLGKAQADMDGWGFGLTLGIFTIKYKYTFEE